MKQRYAFKRSLAGCSSMVSKKQLKQTVSDKNQLGSSYPLVTNAKGAGQVVAIAHALIPRCFAHHLHIVSSSCWQPL